MVRWRGWSRSRRRCAPGQSAERSRRPALENLEARQVLSSGYLQVNLVSDQPGGALVRDPNLIDPWGIGLGPNGGGFWVADHGSGNASIYAGDVSGTPFARNPLVVSVAGGAPTGQASNGTSDFSISLGAASGPAAFVMAGAGGTISGWNQNVPLPSPSTASQTGLTNASAMYTGLTLGNDGTRNLIYAANFAQGTVDVFDRNFAAVSVSGAFADAAVPAGFAPYNVANLGGKLYVTYAKQNAGQLDPAPGNGGYVAVFDYAGHLQKNLVIGQTLDAPWGIAIAPANFGDFSGDLLVGNWGDGRIHAFNLSTGAPLGTLAAPGGAAITVDGLRALNFGNGQTAGDANSLYFTAGLGQHGLFGALKSAQFAPLTAAGASAVVYQGVAFDGIVATFVDANASLSAGSYSTTINWGDGATSAGTVTALGGGRFNLSGTHVYAQTGLRSITTVIQDSSSNLAFASGVANVRTQALAASVDNINATEDLAFQGAVAEFTDADGNISASAYQAWIDWGDGTVSQGIVSADGNGFSVTGAHTFADEATRACQILITDSDGDVITATATATIADADVLTASSLAIVATAGLAFSGAVAKFTDGNLPAGAGDFAATIVWGDGATTSGAISGANGQFTVSGSHTFVSSGSFAVKVAVVDPAPGTASASATSTAQVSSPPITASGFTIVVVEGQSYAGSIASFTDANPNAVATDFAATIDWGDGTTSAGSVMANGPTFQVNGSHVYAAKSAGIAANVLIADRGGGNATAHVLARVLDAPLVATAVKVGGFEQSPLANVTLATFVDQGGALPPAAYSATIDWGDGAVTPGTVAAATAGFVVTGAHTYQDEGNFAFTVAIAETGGSAATVHGTAAILEALLWNGTRGTPTDRWLNEVYGDLLGRVADAGALSYWNARLSQGTNRNAVVSAIEASDEYRARQVQAMFQLYLHRAVDPGGQAFFVAQLRAGATCESLAAALLGSQEYLERSGGQNDSFLAALFQDVLGRPIDPGARTFFNKQLGTGVSRSQIAALLLNSDEYRQQFIGNLYQEFLDHSTSSGSIDFWLGYMKQGGRDEQVLAAIAGSDEFFNKTAP